MSHWTDNIKVQQRYMPNKIHENDGWCLDMGNVRHYYFRTEDGISQLCTGEKKRWLAYLIGITHAEAKEASAWCGNMCPECEKKAKAMVGANVIMDAANEFLNEELRVGIKSKMGPVDELIDQQTMATLAEADRKVVKKIVSDGAIGT